MYCGAGIHSPVSGWFIQPGNIPLDAVGGFFFRSRLDEMELDELLLVDDDDVSRFFFDFFLLPLSLKMLSFELMLVTLNDRSFLMSLGWMRSLFDFFLLSLLRRSKALKSFDGPLMSSAEYFVLIRSKSASRSRMLSTLRCALSNFFCSLWIFFVSSLDSSCVIFWMYFCLRCSSRCRCFSRRICLDASSFCLNN